MHLFVNKKAFVSYIPLPFSVLTVSSPARISPLAFPNPSGSALPTIMGSPTKRGDKVDLLMGAEDILQGVRFLKSLQ